MSRKTRRKTKSVIAEMEGPELGNLITGGHMAGSVELPLIISAKDAEQLKVIDAKVFAKVSKEGKYGIVKPHDEARLFLGVSLEKIATVTGENGAKTSQILVKAKDITFMDSIALGKHLEKSLKGLVKTIEFCMEDCPVDENEIQEIFLTYYRKFKNEN